MGNEEENCDLKDLALKKIKFGEELLKSLEQYKSVEGSQKLGRKISQELKFLRKVAQHKLHIYIFIFSYIIF